MTGDTPSRPLPETDGKMRTFWEAAQQGKFVVQHCGRCGAYRFPAAECCSACLASELSWIETSGRGVLHSFVVVHHALDPYFAARAPYIVADVKLAEGPHITTTIVGASPSELRIGERVEVTFEAVTEAIRLPVFRRIVS
jgi:uncharacterized OB-fold protein